MKTMMPVRVMKPKRKKVKIPKLSPEEKKALDVKELIDRRDRLISFIGEYVNSHSNEYKIFHLFEGLYVGIIKYYRLDVRRTIIAPPTSFQGDTMVNGQIHTYKHEIDQDYCRLIIFDYAISRDISYPDNKWDDVVAGYMPNFFKGACRLFKVYNEDDIERVLNHV